MGLVVKLGKRSKRSARRIEKARQRERRKRNRERLIPCMRVRDLLLLPAFTEPEP